MHKQIYVEKIKKRLENSDVAFPCIYLPSALDFRYSFTPTSEHDAHTIVYNYITLVIKKISLYWHIQQIKG